VLRREGLYSSHVIEWRRAFSAERKSLPSLLMVASEPKAELMTRYPREAPTVAYCEKLSGLRHADNPELAS
jgi:hypothetical protein